jgi:hypothetical protein
MAGVLTPLLLCVQASQARQIRKKMRDITVPSTMILYSLLLKVY